MSVAKGIRERPATRRIEVRRPRPALKRLVARLAPPNYASWEKAHRSRLLFASGLIITGGGALFLVVQLASFALPDVRSAPPMDIATDCTVLLVGALVLRLTRTGRDKEASYLVLGCLLLVAAGELYMTGSPSSDVAGAFALLIFVVMSMVLLERRGAWWAFAVAGVLYAGLHLLWTSGKLPEPAVRGTSGSQAQFTTIVWVACTTFVVAVITSTLAGLRHQAETLEIRVAERTQELRNTQDQLVRHERLAVLGQLAGSVAHELRNPLGVISNAIYFINMTFGGATEEIGDMHREYLELIAAEVHSAERIVSSLLDYSRARSADRAHAPVSDLASQTLVKMPPPKNVALDLQIPPGLPEVVVDPHQIGQVLGNLLINAYQAMPDGGRLTISATTLADPEGREVEEPEVAIAVTDTGHGISEENMGRLFEPLFTTKAKGIGLGLALSKNLAEMNAGRIEVKSEEGRGSTFTVILPTGTAGSDTLAGNGQGG